MRHIVTFSAAGDDGQGYTVLVYEGRGGKMALRTLDGEEVERLDEGRYQVVGTGVLLTSASPNAV